MLSTASRSTPLNSGTLSLHSQGNWRVLEDLIWCYISHHKVAGISWCSEANIRHKKGKMWWFIEICINCAIYWVFVGYHELSRDWILCSQMVADNLECNTDMITKEEPILTHINMRGFRTNFLIPSLSRAQPWKLPRAQAWKFCHLWTQLKAYYISVLKIGQQERKMTVGLTQEIPDSSTHKAVMHNSK